MTQGVEGMSDYHHLRIPSLTPCDGFSSVLPLQGGCPTFVDPMPLAVWLGLAIREHLQDMGQKGRLGYLFHWLPLRVTVC